MAINIIPCRGLICTAYKTVYIITTMFDPSAYFCMVRWHDYRILSLSSKICTTVFYYVFLCLVALHGD